MDSMEVEAALEAAVDKEQHHVDAEQEDGEAKRKRRKRRGWDGPVAQEEPSKKPEDDSALTPEQEAKLAQAQQYIRDQTLAFQQKQTASLASASAAPGVGAAAPLLPTISPALLNVSVGGLSGSAMTNLVAAAAEKEAHRKALQILSRVYLGNVYFEIGEDTLRPLFDPYGGIQGITMSWETVNGVKKHKGYGFLEFDTPEAAILAIAQMNGYTLQSRQIKCGRPNNAPQVLPVLESLTAEAARNHRIYVASIHPDLSNADIKSVFEAFGTIKSIILAPSFEPNKHRGYGWIEYENEAAVNEAVASMHMFDLGGLFLRVCKGASNPLEIIEIVSTRVPSVTSSAAAAIAVPGLAAQSARAEDERRPQSLQQEENVSISGSSQRFMIMQKLIRGAEPSPVIVLKNMVTAGEVDETLEDEIRQECEKFGRIESVVVYVDKVGKHAGNPDAPAKIFVKFSQPEEANRACDALNGRYFAYRSIIAESYSEQKFKARDYSA